MLPSASREQMAYSIDVAKVGVPEALELLLDSVLNPKLPAWEVEAAAKRLEADVLQFQSQDPHGRLLEVRAPPCILCPASLSPDPRSRCAAIPEDAARLWRCASSPTTPTPCVLHPAFGSRKQQCGELVCSTAARAVRGVAALGYNLHVAPSNFDVL